MSIKNTGKYDIIVKMKVPITQSAEWQKLQDDLGEKSFLRQGRGYQFLAIKKHTPVGDYLYCPYGPVANSEADFKNALKALADLGREQGAIFIRIEPQNPESIKYLPKNAQKTKDLSPVDTWLLDLTPEKAEIISHFSQGTRTRYNTFAKKGLTVETTKDPAAIQHLVALQRKLYQKKNLNAYGANYLETELKQPFATLYLVKYSRQHDEARQDTGNYPDDGQILAASLFFDHDDTRYYMQSAADGDYKRLPATVALLTGAIFDAKAKGLKFFDFWGIAPDGAPKTHPWYGFTEFKKSFGGFAAHYAGTYDIVLKPTKYRLYQTTRKVNRLIRR